MLLGIGFLSSCASLTPQTENRIASSLAAKEFNSISSTYMNRPTFVSSVIMKDGSQSLYVKVDSYGSAKGILSLSYANRDFYVRSIDKFLEWEKKAKANKHAFNKEIGNVKELSGRANYYLEFVSGNEQSHYLEVGIQASLAGKLEIASFDRSNALKLRKLLLGMPYSEQSVSSSYQ